MQCCVPFCESSSHKVSVGSQGKGGKKEISFHSFPSEINLRAAWLRALGKQDAHLPESAVVCSQHFLYDELYETENGFRQIVTGAIPSTVQVCMICLETDCELNLLSKYQLKESYENLTAYPVFDLGNLKPTVCVQCAQRLTDCSRFRDKSLRARLLMMDLIAKYEFITIQHVKIINHTLPQADPCDSIKVEHCDEVTQIDLNEEDLHRVMETVAVKNEEPCETIGAWSVDDTLTEDIINEVSEEDNSDYSIALAEKLLNDDLYKSLNWVPADDELEIKIHDPVKCESATVITNSKHTTQRLNDNPHPHAELTHNLFAATSVGVRGAAKNSKEVLRIDIGEANKQSSDIYKRTDVNIDRLASCVVKLVDVVKHPRQAAPIRDGPLMETRAVTNLCDRRNVDAAAKDPQCHATAPNAVSTSGPKSNSCSTLQSKTDRLTSDDVHIRRNSSSHNSLLVERKWFTCDVCPKSFTIKSNLVQHIKTHTGEKPYSCTLCDYRSARNGNLTLHMRTHTDEKLYYCKLCNYKSRYSYILMRHMKTHTGEKPYSCKLCDYKAAEKRNLMIHMTNHTGEKLYSCKLCAYKAGSKHYLMQHMKTHTAEKPFSCDLCDYKAGRKSYIIRHMRKHTGEKPYSCKLCNYKSGQKRTLTSHMRTHW